MIVIERPREVGQPRRKVWCNKADLTAQGESYVFNDLAQDALGFGSIVFVVDEPGLVLWYDNESGEMYERVLGSGGGSSVTVEELDVTENGTYTAPSGTAYSPVVVEVAGGSGNPNYVQVIEGTVANPWGDVDPAVANEGLFNRNVSMYISASSSTAKGYAGQTTATSVRTSGVAFYYTDTVIKYKKDGTLQTATTGGTQIDPTHAAWLTIVWHNLEGGPTGTLPITENGTYNVAPYATAAVNVSGSGSGAVVYTISGIGSTPVAPPEDWDYEVALSDDTTLESLVTTALVVNCNGLEYLLYPSDIGENLTFTDPDGIAVAVFAWDNDMQLESLTVDGVDRTSTARWCITIFDSRGA